MVWPLSISWWARRMVAASNGASSVRHRRAEDTGVDELGHPFERVVLDSHVGSMEERSGEHELPVPGDALGFERHQIQVLRIIDGDDAAPGEEDVCECVDVPGRVGREQVAHAVGSHGADLCDQVMMIDHVVGAQRQHPLLRFRGRGRCHHRHLGEGPSQLDHHRAGPAGSTHDEEGAPALGGQRPPVEERLPCHEGGQGHRCRFAETERRWLGPDDSLVDHVELRIGPGSVDGPGVVDLVAHRERRHLSADGFDHSRCVPSQYGRISLGITPPSPLDVDRIDRHGAHVHQ